MEKEKKKKYSEEDLIDHDHPLKNTNSVEYDEDDYESINLNHNKKSRWLEILFVVAIVLIIIFLIIGFVL